MRYPFLLLIVLAGSCLTACQPAALREAQLRDEAQSYYQETAEIQREILAALDHLEQERNQINIQGRALSTEEQGRVRAIEALLGRYASFSQGFSPVKAESLTRREVTRQKASLELIQSIRAQLEALQ